MPPPIEHQTFRTAFQSGISGPTLEDLRLGAAFNRRKENLIRAQLLRNQVIDQARKVVYSSATALATSVAQAITPITEVSNVFLPDHEMSGTAAISNRRGFTLNAFGRNAARLTLGPSAFNGRNYSKRFRRLFTKTKRRKLTKRHKRKKNARR